MKRKEKAWNRMRKPWNEICREEYWTRNEYVKIREVKNFARGIVRKCKEESKLFYI